MERFLAVVRLKVSATTYYRKMYQLRAFYNYLTAHRLDYNDLRQSDIENYLLSLRSGRSYRVQVCCVLREFYDFIKHPENPARNIPFKPFHGRKLFQTPSQSAVESIIRNLSAEDTVLSLRNRLIVELAYGSGLRRAELSGLNIDDVDLTARTVRVQGKGGAERVVPLTQESIESIREYLARRTAYTGPLLVAYHGRRLTSNGIYYMLKQRTGIRTHQLRHACATHMLKNGCTVRVIQELLGHKRLTATQVYTHILKEDLRHVLASRHPRSCL
jgi:integrase/recombinase XerC